MPNIFRITSSEGGKLQLEAAASHTDYTDTIFHNIGPTGEFMQLELDLFPLNPDENVDLKVGQTVRLVSLAPVYAPAPTPETKPRSKVGVRF